MDKRDVEAGTRLYLKDLQRDMRDAVQDLRRSQRTFTELRTLHAPNGTSTELIRFLALAEVRQAISDKDYACQRMAALGAVIAAEIATYTLLYT